MSASDTSEWAEITQEHRDFLQGAAEEYGCTPGEYLKGMIEDDMHDKHEIDEELVHAEEDAQESHADDANSYGAGYDRGFVDGIKRGRDLATGVADV